MSEQEGNRLSLEALAHRLEALGRQNEQMRAENAKLRGEASALRSSGTRRGEVPAPRGSDRRPEQEVASEIEGRVSRRAFLSKAGAAAVGAVAGGCYSISAKSKRHRRLTCNAFTRASKVIRR